MNAIPKKKISYSLALFLISPFLSIPVLFIDIYKRRKGALLCFSMLMGVFSYLLLPDWSLDLARYYIKYDEISRLSFIEFKDYLEASDDYLFYILFFLFSSVGLKFQALLFCLTTFNFYIVFKVFDKIADFYQLNKKKYFKYFFLVLTSISFLYYLSATRYILGCSFFILFLYYYYFSKNKLKSYVFLLISVFVHIGVLYYIPFIILISKINNKKLLISVSSVLLLAGFLVPLNSLIDALSSVLPAFALKAKVYLELNREEAFWPSIFHMGSVVLGFLFLINFQKEVSKTVFNLFLFAFIAVLVCLPLHFIVYDRFIILYKIVFAYSLLSINVEYFGVKKKMTFKFIQRSFFLLSLCYLIFSIYFYRNNFTEIIKIDSFFLYTIFSKTYTPSDFFYL